MPDGQPPPSGGLTGLGKLISVVLVLALIGLGAWMVIKKNNAAPPKEGVVTGKDHPVTPDNTGGNTLNTAELVDTKTEVPRLAPPLAYVPKDNILDVELSEYAGYAGLIAANNGLEPSNDSVFAKKHGFKVRIKISEEESWSSLNAGKMAASATTADVLAVYGRQFQVVVPAQIGYSRGADGLVVRSDIKKVNDLKGNLIAAAQFTESDFFIRYLAHEAGLNIKMLSDLTSAPDPDAINLVFCSDGLAAGSLFAKSLQGDNKTLAGCTTWAPATTDIPAQSNGKAKLLVSNKNLLIVADVLVVNKGFAEQSPDKVYGLVDGMLAGNQMVRDNPEQYADLIAKAFTSPKRKWDHARAISELQKVHLANLPENLAFFSGNITQGGSFASIYQSAILAYGDGLIPNPVDSDRFVATAALEKAKASGAYKDQQAAILPLAKNLLSVAETPTLSKNIIFYFDANSTGLDMTDADKRKNNIANLEAIKRIMDVSPGSHVTLVGHGDNSRVAELMKSGGQKAVDEVALTAVQLSKDRAKDVMKQLIDIEHVDPSRLEANGRGWQQPISTTNQELNRRVEVQWFTLE